MKSFPKKNKKKKMMIISGDNVKKTIVLNTLVTMTLVSDVENSKN